MDLSFGPEYEAFRREVRKFLRGWPLRGAEAKLPRSEQERLFRARAVERGYAYRSIPRRYGGSEQPFDVLKDAILEQEFGAAGAPHNLRNQGVGYFVPTLLECGSEEQRERFIPKTLTGEYLWCQGYSEPGSGSDLASLRSSARLEGDHWVINGHKIWTSDAREASHMFGLFRTEPNAPKHAGISYLLLEMRQPGIDVRPLKQITGGAHFNEVFYTNARTPADWIVGKRGQGWLVSRATLKHERVLSGSPTFQRRRFEGLVRLARRAQRRGRPAIEDPGVRQRLAEIECCVRSQETSYMRQLSAAARGEEDQVALLTLTAKLYGTQTHDRLVRLAYDLLDADGLLAPGPDDYASYAGSERAGGWVEQYLFALGGAIAAGSSNIQRNIIGERGLGLPRDLRLGD
jgi:alkylation response protein AidB-like acyl-CoA dehydrogenase